MINKKKIVIGIIVLIIFLVIPIILLKTKTNSDGPITQQCVRHGPKGIHLHPVLEISIDGIKQEIPKDIGVISFFCMRPLHTHDDAGIIHIESRIIRDFTLGDFFTIWDKTFNRSCIFDYCSDKGNLTVYVNGIKNEDYETLILRDQDKIRIEYTTIDK